MHRLLGLNSKDAKKKAAEKAKTDPFVSMFSLIFFFYQTINLLYLFI
jgi:hypothetical protein